MAGVAPLARISDRTNARLGEHPHRRVCGMLTGGAGRREEYLNQEAVSVGLGMMLRERRGAAARVMLGEPRAIAAAARRRAACPQTSAAGEADAIPTLIPVDAEVHQKRQSSAT